MTSQCQPTVNRFWKMVPEGGFEPPTRGFSIQRLVSVFNAIIVNRTKNTANSFKYLADRLQTVGHSLLKRKPFPISPVNPQGGSSRLTQSGAVMCEALAHDTAFLPQGEF